MKKILIIFLISLITVPVVIGGLFTPTPPPPMIGPQGPEGPMGPPGPPGNYTIGNGLELISNGTEIQLNLSLLNELYNDTALIISVNSTIWSELNNKLDITDQRYNDTTLIQQVNTSLLGEISLLEDDIITLFNNFDDLSDDIYLINLTLNERIDNISLELQDDFVLKAGDTMTGNLNMSDNNITDVHTLFVHNLTGRSPIFVSSDMISANTIQAETFFGNIQGANGTIFGVTITNGTIQNLHVSDEAYFDTEVTFNGSLIPAIDNTYDLGTLNFRWRNFFTNNLVADNISSPQITELYELIDNLTEDIKQPHGPYLDYNDTNFWVNEVALNATIEDISKVRKLSYNMTCTTVGGDCSVVSNIPIEYKITQIRVYPTDMSDKYRFELTEHPNTVNIIDRDLKQHDGIWDIYKSYALNGQVEANIISAQNDQQFTIEVIYLYNGMGFNV